jgi:hypothetical protein
MFIIGITSCNKNVKSSESIENEFAKSRKLSVAKVYESIFVGDPAELVVMDSLVFLLELNQEKFIRCYNLNTEQECALMLTKGTGPNETPSALRVQPYGRDSIQVFGKHPYTFFTYSIRDILDGKDEKPTKYLISDSIEVKPSGILLTDQNALFHAVDKTSEAEKRFCLYDVKMNKYEFFGEYIKNAFMEINYKINKYDKAFSFQPRLTFNQNKKLVASVTANFLGIEIIDPFQKKIIKSKYYEMPKIVTQRNNNLNITISFDGQKAGFISPSTTSNSIYCLYSGKANGDNGYYYGKTILKYSWNLKPLERYEFDLDILLIQVTPDERYLYAICIVGKDYKLVKFNLKE